MKLKITKAAAAVALAAVISVLSGCNTQLDLGADTLPDELSSASSSGSGTLNGTDAAASSSKEDVDSMELYFVTGVSAPIALRESDDDKSEVVAQLENGAAVRLVSADSGAYYYVYSEDKDSYGYLKKNYLTNEEPAVCKGETYFISDATSLYSSNDSSSAELQKLSKNAQVTVIAKTSGDYWYVNLPDTKTFGYVKVSNISSKKSDTSSKNTSSKNTSKSNTNSTYSVGSGSAPTTSYSVFYAKVNTGYLAVRSEQNASDSNIIGQLYTGDTVYAIAESGTYWYCYAPSLGIYGYINANYLVSTKPSSTAATYDTSTKWVVKVDKGYLALRSEAKTSDSNIIGKLYTGDYVYLESYNSYYDTYWYVYSPSLGMYGYVNSNYIYS